MEKRRTVKLAWETAWQWMNTKCGYCVAALVVAAMTAIFVGNSIVSRILGAIFGAATGIGVLLCVLWLGNFVIISHRQRRDRKWALARIKYYIESGKPMPEEEADRLRQLIELSNLPVSYTHTKNCSVRVRVVWEGQSNVIYTDVVGKEVVIVNVAVVGHSYTSGIAKIGLEEFVVTTVGFADKDSVFKVLYENQELGCVFIARDHRESRVCENRNTADIVNGSLNEALLVVRKMIGKKVTWEKRLSIPLDLPIGERMKIQANA